MRKRRFHNGHLLHITLVGPTCWLWRNVASFLMSTLASAIVSRSLFVWLGGLPPSTCNKNQNNFIVEYGSLSLHVNIVQYLVYTIVRQREGLGMTSGIRLLHQFTTNTLSLSFVKICMLHAFVLRLQAFERINHLNRIAPCSIIYKRRLPPCPFPEKNSKYSV